MATRTSSITATPSTDLDILFEQLPAAVFVADAPSGRVHLANDRARELWGGIVPLPDSVDEYSTAFTGYRPDGRQYASDEWPLSRAVVHGERVTDEEIEFVLPSGERRVFLVSAVPVRDELGEITRASALLYDVTVLRQEERRREFLMALTDELRLLDDPMAVMETAVAATGEQLGVSTASYADVDPNGRFAVVHAEYRNGRVVHNAKYYLEDFGPDLADRLRRGDTVVVEDTDADPRSMRELFEGWGLRSLIAAPIVRQGRLVALFAVLHNAPRHWTRSDIALVEQVAERTWHTVESASAQDQLRQSRERLSLALRAGSAAVWDWNVRSGEIRWSEEHDTLVGLTEPRRALTFTRWLSLVHPDDRAAARAAARQIATMREGEIEFEYRVAGTAEPRWITMRGRVVGDERGVPLRVVGIAADTTERKTHELERELLLAQAREASESKSHFIGVISHEFRTPLTAIIGYSDLLSTGVSGQVSPAQARQLDRIRASAWHLTQMVDEILTFSRIEAGREVVSPEPTDVLAIGRDTAALIGPAAAIKGLGVACELPDSPVTVRTDSGKLRQILLNLLGNAVKFTETGGVRLRVRASSAEVEFAVIDTGQGIAAHHIDHIFERFWQVRGAGATTVAGAGLGLTVSRQLADLLGGRITVESEPGAGSTFRLTIPR
jgi:signal transduction histidine kinase